MLLDASGVLGFWDRGRNPYFLAFLVLVVVEIWLVFTWLVMPEPSI